MILSMKWDYKVDIWNVGVVIRTANSITQRCKLITYCIQVWDLFQSEALFTSHDVEGNFDDSYHLASMVAIMGPPPPEFLQRSKMTGKF